MKGTTGTVSLVYLIPFLLKLLVRASASSKVNTIGVEILVILGIDGCSVVGESFSFLRLSFRVFAVKEKEKS